MEIIINNYCPACLKAWTHKEENGKISFHCENCKRENETFEEVFDEREYQKEIISNMLSDIKSLISSNKELQKELINGNITRHYDIVENDKYNPCLYTEIEY